ncbi:hypothetical protein DSM106972_061170 [Dulcicalothrix desertica PCC 7102]|uniref:AAA+ ATPase domain-containing protein n=1 Tax=Dulcicalothrix desertica PCC 7102 TaxID=232991 RepID=A0A433V7E9_9CYAN|nr:AAA family ATPase [Dulcicalothrix desertica]RUT02042.1 hypothetical protein DSM106972_061170 [Dulcicalothrix desertica PCC 7102]TWH53691.1 RecA/RadA recombinase [Dulcicalothrix desertica PCC 7102]
MKNLVQSQPEQINSSTANKPQYPILWVSNVIDASNSHLSNLFDIRGFEEIGDYTAIDAQHYIVDVGASEEIIKAIAWTIGECSIWHCESKLPLSYLAPDHATSIEVFDNIFNHSKPIEDWLKATNQEFNKLQHQDAVNLAQVAIRLLKGSQKTTELDILRRRCNENPFNWNNLMKELESEFQEELERRYIAAKQQTRRDRLRLELLTLSEETDILAWDDTLNDIAQRYGKKVSRLESMLVQLIDSTSKPKARHLTSSEFHATQTSDVEWLIPGLMPATGVTLMVANPGVGKTTLGYDLAASVIYNEKFLDEKPLKTGKVIFVNSFGEMSDNEMLSSFIDRRIGVSDKYELLLDWDMTQLPKLEKMIEELQPTLIVIDSYRGITGYLPNFDENNSKAGLPIRRLQGLCNRYKTAMLVIHHNKKSQEYAEIAKSAGNFSIAASSSAVWQLDKDLVSNTIKLSTAKIRGAERRELKITLDGFDRHFDVISDSAKQNEQQTKAIKSKIISLLSLNPDDAMPLKDIPGLIEESYDSTRITIDRLIKEGIVSKFLGGKDNREKLVKLTHTPPSPYSVLKTTSSTHQSNDIQAFDNTEQNTEQYAINTEQNQIVQHCSVPCPESEVQPTQPIQQMTNNLENEDKGEGANNFSNHDTESLEHDTYQVNTRNCSSETSVPKVPSSKAPTQTNKATHETIKTDSDKSLDIFPVGAKVKSKHPGYQKDKIGKVIVNKNDVPTPGVARVQWYTPEGYKAEVTTTNTCALKLTDDS